MKKVDCIMLVDDNLDDNFYHERVIRKSGAADKVVPLDSAEKALEYLRLRSESTHAAPAILFLDINMPGMNGWEFMDEYQKLDQSQHAGMVIIMLTTSESPDDNERARGLGQIADFRTKPLTSAMLKEILEKYHML